MKLYNILAAAVVVSMVSFSSCKDEDSYNGAYLGEPYTYNEDVTYTVKEERAINDSVNELVDVEYVRQRPTLACKVYPAGDHGVAIRHGFCYNTTGNPTVYDNVILIDESWSGLQGAVVGLQNGLYKDTTFVNTVSPGTVYVRAFLVPYTAGNDALTNDPTVVYSEQSVMTNFVIED
jgi:hypothetical protein